MATFNIDTAALEAYPLRTYKKATVQIHSGILKSRELCYRRFYLLVTAMKEQYADDACPYTILYEFLPLTTSLYHCSAFVALRLRFNLPYLRKALRSATPPRCLASCRFTANI